MSEIVCDYPELHRYLATIFLDYCQFTGDLSPLDKISFSDEFYQSQDADLVFIFYQDFCEIFYEMLEHSFPVILTYYLSG